MFFHFQNIPWQVDVFLVVLFSLLISMGMTWFFRKYIRQYFPADVDIHLKTLDIAGVMLAFLIGFAVFITQTWYDKADETDEEEANLIQSNLMQAKVFGEENKVKINEAYLSYVHYLIDVEWPLLAQGKDVSVSSTPYLEKLENVYNNILPETETQKAAYAVSISNLAALNLKRAAREKIASSSLHSIIWMLIIFFATIMLIYVFLYPIENVLYNNLICFTFVLIVFILCLFIYLLEYPFDGDIHVRNTPFTSILKAYEHY